MENKYNVILSVFVFIVIGGFIIAYHGFFKDLPQIKGIQISTRFNSPLNKEGDSINNSSAESNFENFISKKVRKFK